jgi:hypothetical protein
MSISRSKLYTILLIACMAGYMWLFYSMANVQPEKNTVEVCLIKHATNIPCPSCGSTRAVLSLVHGDFLKSLYINPFGIIIALIMLIAPVWILVDVTTRKNSLLYFYRQMEAVLKKPVIAIPLVLFVLMNWIWNITKEL